MNGVSVARSLMRRCKGQPGSRTGWEEHRPQGTLANLRVRRYILSHLLVFAFIFNSGDSIPNDKDMPQGQYGVLGYWDTGRCSVSYSLPAPWAN